MGQRAMTMSIPCCAASPSRAATSLTSSSSARKIRLPKRSLSTLECRARSDIERPLPHDEHRPLFDLREDALDVKTENAEREDDGPRAKPDRHDQGRPAGNRSSE